MTPAELAQSIIDADSSFLRAETALLLGLDTDAPFTAPLLAHLLDKADHPTYDTIERITAIWHDGFAAGLIASDTEMSEMLGSAADDFCDDIDC